jgi:hypothetical protein
VVATAPESESTGVVSESTNKSFGDSSGFLVSTVATTETPEITVETENVAIVDDIVTDENDGIMAVAEEESEDAGSVDDSDYYTVEIPQNITLKPEDTIGEGRYSTDFQVGVSSIDDSYESVTITLPTEFTVTGSGYAAGSGDVTGSITSSSSSSGDTTDTGLAFVVDQDAMKNGTNYEQFAAAVELTPGDWDGWFNVEVEAKENPTPIAFAVYSEDDNSLKFYKRTKVPAVGDTFNGLTVTAVYEGIESNKYSVETPWFAYRQKIKSVDFVDTIQPIATAYWFWLFSSCTEINLERLFSYKRLIFDENCSIIIVEDRTTEGGR